MKIRDKNPSTQFFHSRKDFFSTFLGEKPFAGCSYSTAFSSQKFSEKMGGEEGEKVLSVKKQTPSVVSA